MSEVEGRKLKNILNGSHLLLASGGDLLNDCQ